MAIRSREGKPSLASAGATTSLANPTLSLRDANGNVIANNDDWQDSQQADIAATGEAPPNTKESAILALLAPGYYTAIVTGEEWNYRRWVNRILQFTLNRKSTTQRGRIGVDTLSLSLDWLLPPTKCEAGGLELKGISGIVRTRRA